MLKKGDTVQFTARRWMDSYGNTYHVVDVGVLRKGANRWTDLGESDITYGYGSHYEQTGREILEEAFSYPRGWRSDAYYANRDRPLWHLRDFGVEFVSDARDVKRKRDL